ncbi:MAG: TolB-like 6-bladed beta-propeller domain-containing protein [Dysgonamonadaceae bacterium]|jgi:hypothetical protein|nr:TolB-like 6-bladed beta-propeller domain-containing protein [Dysgonamonadaceae bacterium]
MKKPLIIIIVLTIYACSYSNKERVMHENMPVIEELKAKKIAVNEVLNPTDMKILDDYFVFQNQRNYNEDCYFVYTKDKLKFCYSFGRLGKGPNEYIAPGLVHGTKGNNFSIYDPAHNKIYEFLLSDKKPEPVNEIKIKDFYYPVQDISYVNEKIILLLLLTNKDVNLYSYDIETNNIIDTLSFQTKLKDKLQNDYNSMFDDFNFSNDSNKIVISFNFINKIVVTHVDERGYFTEKDHAMPDIALNKKSTENIWYYLFPIATSSYYYTQYYGKLSKYMQPFPFNLEDRSLDFLIEVYDWQQKPVRLLHLDSEIIRFYVNEKTQKLYTWNPLKDFDFLLEYDLKK